MFSKPKHFAFSLILFPIVFLIFTLNHMNFTINNKRQMHDEFQNMTAYLDSLESSEWFNVIAREIKVEKIKIGLVNVDRVTHEIRRKAEIVKVDFELVGEQIQWSDLFPAWIDNDSPYCPDIPMPKFEDYQELDVIVAAGVSHDAECEVGSRSSNVLRLQVNLVVANLLVKSGRDDDRPKFAVFMGSCDPMWEIFTCDDIFWHEGNTLVYKPELKRIKEKVLMPVGSCEYVPPIPQLGEELHQRSHYDTISKSEYNVSKPREAYVTILHSSEKYVCGAIALAQSIKQLNSTKDLILLADDNISAKSLEGLQASGWKIKHIQRIRSPYSNRTDYNNWNYSKLRIWQLKEYDRVMFIDSDLLVTRNLDAFFMYPQLTAAANYEKHLFNSGLMIVEPSLCTFDTLMKKRYVVESYNGGDQGFLNEMFTWWHRFPSDLNYLKIFLNPDDHVHQIDEDVYAIHYTGLKPWTCSSKEYDCNWDFPELDLQQYASNSAHAKWWNVYYTMPEKLRQYCSVTPETEKLLQRSRNRRSENASVPDESPLQISR